MICEITLGTVIAVIWAIIVIIIIFIALALIGRILDIRKKYREGTLYGKQTQMILSKPQVTVATKPSILQAFKDLFTVDTSKLKVNEQGKYSWNDINGPIAGPGTPISKLNEYIQLPEAERTKLLQHGISVIKDILKR